MSRASIGVQDFDPEIQKVIGREQSFEITQAAVDGIRARVREERSTPISSTGCRTRAALEDHRFGTEATLALAGPRGALRLRACAMDGAAPDD